MAAASARAQDTLPPSQGGTIRSLGLPEIWKPYLGVGVGMISRDTTQIASQARIGVYRDLMNPVAEVLGWSAEYFVGVNGVRLDHGARLFLLSNMLRLGWGVQYRPDGGTLDLLLTFTAPVRRGGLLGRGTDLRFEWLPTHGGALNLAFTVPLHQPHRGATRPAHDYVHLEDAPRPPEDEGPENPELVAALDRVHDHALWVGRLVAPGLHGPGGDAAASARASLQPVVQRLGEDRTVEQEIREYHAALAQAFSVAVGEHAGEGGARPLGDSVAAAARAILLDRVLFPYDRLLGQRRKTDTTRGFARHARGVFARWLVTSSGVPPGPAYAAVDVFQHLLDDVEQVRAERREAMRDARLVWLPLQLALLPEQYDEQEEIDSLISRAVGHPFTHGNRIWYVHDDRFELELIRSIGLAEDYHILWVHDFRGANSAGRLDRLSVLVATRAYLAALRDRVAMYDRTGHMPVYMIFLDQHYFEVNRSRALLNVLQDPLTRSPSLPRESEAQRQELQAALDGLRRAVGASRLLQAERAQYGDRWLRDLISVHVNITNPADPSFRSRQLLPLIGVPDDVMRDHRKVVLYDVSEADPYRGMAMYTGMGVGEHYAGAMWEDRAMMLQGPAALGLRDQARALLEAQGIQGGEVPHILRPQPFAPDYQRRVAEEIARMDSLGGASTRALQLHNLTGFAMKEVSVADATLFSLLPPGGVLKIPDSLWMNELLASLLAGSALRGVRVLMIMPGTATAPSAGFPQLALMHDLGSRVLVATDVLAPALLRTGGLLRLGIYDPNAGVTDLVARVRALRDRLAEAPFLRDLFAFGPGVYAMLDSVDTALPPQAAPVGDGAPPGEVAARPKLHMKGFLFVSREPWARLISGLPMGMCVREYIVQRARQLREGAAVDEDAMSDAMQRCGAAAINPVLESVPVAERNCPAGIVHCGGGRWAFYLQVGSLNEDYRSMGMDGEAAVLVSNWTSLIAVYDYVLLAGLAAWPETQADLNRLLTPPSSSHLSIARWARPGI